MLDAEVAAWREHCAAHGYPVDAPVPAAKGLTVPEVKVRDRVVIEAVMSAVAPHIHELEQKLAALSTRVLELERKGYVGIWKEGKEYSPQSEVTHEGARWISHKRTTDRPGSSADWTMMEKSEPANPRSESAAAHARNGSFNPANPRFR
jgi:hypothetical protein